MRYPLPASLRDSALAYSSGQQEAVAAKDAATVVLMRDAPGGLECYLMRRRTSMAFAARMYVFPGGGVDLRDTGSVAWVGPPAAEWGDRLSCAPELAHALVCAAVRETFEEAGVLLAGRDGDSVVDVAGCDWEADRAAVAQGSSSLHDVLERRGLGVRSDLLAAWTRWITPAFEPRRYDTRFFVAALPAGQRTRDVSTESDLVAWMTPAEALAGKVPLMLPTRVTLTELAQRRTVAEVLSAAHARRIVAIEPRAVRDGDAWWLQVNLP